MTQSSQNFKALRTQLGLTQAELGERLGLTERQVRNLESGKTPVKAHHQLAIESLKGRKAR